MSYEHSFTSGKRTTPLVKVWQRYSILSATNELLRHPTVGPTGGSHRLERFNDTKSISLFGNQILLLNNIIE